MILSFMERFRQLRRLIELKQKACKVKYETIKNMLLLGNDTKHMKKKQFQFQSVKELILQLININRKDLIVMSVLSTIVLVMRIFIANFNNFLIGYLLDDNTIVNLIIVVLILILVRVSKCLLDQWSQYLQMNYGYQQYSSLYYFFISNKKHLTGQILNIIEDDMQKIVNLPYAAINLIFQTIMIFALTIMITLSINQHQLLVTFTLIFLFVFTSMSGILVFRFNQRLMHCKDSRLQLNINKSDNKNIQKARQKQVNTIKQFVAIKIIVKWVTQLSFLLLFCLVFLFSQNQSTNDEQLYYQFMLIGMLKFSFTSLFTESYSFALVANSLKRIINCHNRDNLQSQTVEGYDDFIKINSKKNIHIRESIQTLTNSQIDQSFVSQNFQSNRNSTTKQLLNDGIKLLGQSSPQKIYKQENTSSQKYVSNIILKPIKSQLRQKGQVKLFSLLRYIHLNVPISLISFCIFLLLLTLLIMYEMYSITNSIVHNTLESPQWTIMMTPSLLYPLVMITFVALFFVISKKLFNNIKVAQLQGDELNRISGDICLVDKMLALNIYSFIINLFAFAASIVYSVSLINQVYLQIFVFILLGTILYASFYYNRYYMKSVRQIRRLQCRLKSKIIQQYLNSPKLNQKQINKKIIQKNWKKIYACKNVTIAIQNCYIVLLNVLVLFIQIICLVVCCLAQIEGHSARLLLVFMLQIDLSISGLFLSSINLEMGLVNFQRCINFFKSQANNQPQLKK